MEKEDGECSGRDQAALPMSVAAAIFLLVSPLAKASAVSETCEAWLANQQQQHQQHLGDSLLVSQPGASSTRS